MNDLEGQKRRRRNVNMFGSYDITYSSTSNATLRYKRQAPIKTGYFYV